MELDEREDDWEKERARLLRYTTWRSVRWGRLGMFLLTFVDGFNGLWSGFPPCCVLAFLKLNWREEWSPPHAVALFLEYVRCQEDYDYWRRVDYVQCRKCFEGRSHLPTEKIRPGGLNRGWLMAFEIEEDEVENADVRIPVRSLSSPVRGVAGDHGEAPEEVPEV